MVDTVIAVLEAQREELRAENSRLRELLRELIGKETASEPAAKDADEWWLSDALVREARQALGEEPITEREPVCSKCGGTGFDRRSTYAGNRFPCPACKGSGKNP